MITLILQNSKMANMLYDDFRIIKSVPTWISKDRSFIFQGFIESQRKLKYLNEIGCYLIYRSSCFFCKKQLDVIKKAGYK